MGLGFSSLGFRGLGFNPNLSQISITFVIASSLGPYTNEMPLDFARARVDVEGEGIPPAILPHGLSKTS